MKTILFWCSCLAFSISVHAEEVVQLFNGKDLSGWKVECLAKDKDKNYWSVKDGTIQVDTKGDKKHDYVWLTYDKEFSDFELTIKVRSIRKTKGNSGIQIRSRFIKLPEGSKTSHFLCGPQIDIHPPTPFRIGLIYDETIGNQRWIFPSMKDWAIKPTDVKHVYLWNTVETPVPLAILSEAEQKAGWNVLKIRAQGYRIQTWLNGLDVADYDGSDVLNSEHHKKYNVGRTGKISLQLHNADDLALQFKDISLKKIATHKAP